MITTKRLFGCAFVAGFLVALSFSGCIFRPGTRFLIPDGYVGWVKIYYGVDDAPALEMFNGQLLIRVASDGTARTATTHDSRYGTDEYFYEDASGRLRPLKQEGVYRKADALVHSHTYISSKTGLLVFFVGPRSTMDESTRPAD